ncbi:MAG: ABC transporter permease, partial [Phycisphaerae bacterium]|nr:ABC transporter permease [Phycisphaerae bacterium]
VRVATSQPDAFEQRLLGELQPHDLGLRFEPIRAQQLAAAGGTTDFAQLFIGFSFFIIAAAIMLVALLFRLAIEQRARQIGLMTSLGFGRARLMKLYLAEGAILAIVGGAIGSAGGVGYCAVIMFGLRTWWVGAVGTTALQLHIGGMSVCVGLAAAIVIALAAMAWGAWRVIRIPPAALLAGAATVRSDAVRRFPRKKCPDGHTTNLSAAALALVAVGALVAWRFGKLSAQIAFLSAGGLLLAAAIVFVAGRWRGDRIRLRSLTGPAAVVRLGVRNAARYPGRSLLAVSLLAFASFVLVIVGSMRQNKAAEVQSRESGAGGFSLMLTANVPLTGDLNTPTGRKLVGLRDDPRVDFSRVTFVQFGRSAGQDASCLNMVQPGSPTVFGVPDAMMNRGGFAREGNPWKLLLESRDREIPMIADAATAEYSLHVGLGDKLTIRDEAGSEAMLVLVATLHDSIFQGGVLISDANFRRLFPSRGGFGLVLVEAPPAEVPALADLLSRDLGEMAVTVESTANRLAAYAAVANTYLSTFQALGSLGLLLGTVGLAVVLIRSLIERRGELALLAALGFGPRRRLLLILAENAYLLALGLLIGGGCALLAVAPALARGEQRLNLLALAATLAGIGMFGLAVLTAAALIGGRRFAVRDLRVE